MNDITNVFRSDREDELRARQLEEEIAEGRRRRQALRAERARSLSPEKSILYSEKLETIGSEQKENELLSKEQEIKNTIESLVEPTHSLKLFQDDKDDDKLDLKIGQKITPKRLASGPKPAIAPKPSSLSNTPESKPATKKDYYSPPSKIYGTPTKTYNTPSTKATPSPRSLPKPVIEKPSTIVTSPSNGLLEHKKSILDLPRTPVLHNSDSNPALNRSTTLARSPSPSRVGFVQSAMLRREGTISRSNGSIINHRSSPRLTNSPSLSPPMSLRSSAAKSHLRTDSSQSIDMPKSTSIDSISSVSTNISLPPVTSSNDSTPTKMPQSMTSFQDSRRWSPVRQTWLESALKKNAPASPSDRGLARSGSVLTRSPSTKPPAPAADAFITYSPAGRHGRTMSIDRQPSTLSMSSSLDKKPTIEKRLSTTFDNPSKIRNKSEMLLVIEKKPSIPSLLQPRTLDRSPERSSGRLEKLSFLNRTPSPPGPKIEQTGTTTLARAASLKPMRPPPPLTEKPSVEAIEKLRNLRTTTTKRYDPKDEVKETIERAKSVLKRSNTEKYQAPDVVKETLLSAKGALKSRSPERPTSSIIQTKVIPEEEGQVEEQSSSAPSSYAKSNSTPNLAQGFSENLESMLKRGPIEPANIQRSHTFDSSELNGKKTSSELTHMTKTRTKGPRRRLPKSAMAPTALREIEPLVVSKNRSVSSQKLKPLIRSSSRSVSYSPPKEKKSPPKPRIPSSSVRLGSTKIAQPEPVESN